MKGWLMTDHMRRKHKLESLSKSQIIDLIENAALSEDERKIMELLYIRRRPLKYVADIMAYSESGLKKKHARILKRTIK